MRTSASLGRFILKDTDPMANTFMLIGSLTGFLKMRQGRFWCARLAQPLVTRHARRLRNGRALSDVPRISAARRSGRHLARRGCGCCPSRGGPLLPAWCIFSGSLYALALTGIEPGRHHAGRRPRLSPRMGLSGTLRGRALTCLDKFSGGLETAFHQAVQAGWRCPHGLTHDGSGVRCGFPRDDRFYCSSSPNVRVLTEQGLPPIGPGRNPGQRQGFTEFSWKNPHSALFMNVTDGPFQGQELRGGTEQPGRHDPAGLDQEAVPSPGDEVVINVHPSRTGAAVGECLSCTVIVNGEETKPPVTATRT